MVAKDSLEVRMGKMLVAEDGYSVSIWDSIDDVFLVHRRSCTHTQYDCYVDLVSAYGGCLSDIDVATKAINFII